MCLLSIIFKRPVAAVAETLADLSSAGHRFDGGQPGLVGSAGYNALGQGSAGLFDFWYRLSRGSLVDAGDGTAFVQGK